MQWNSVEPGSACRTKVCGGECGTTWKTITISRKQVILTVWFLNFFQSHKIDIRTNGGKVIGLGTLHGNTDICATEKGVSRK